MNCVLQRALQKKLMALPNVEIIWDTVVHEICGEDQVEALFIENKKPVRRNIFLWTVCLWPSV